MSADVFIAFYGIEFPVPDGEALTDIEEQNDDRVVRARMHKLDWWLGRLTDGLPFHLLIGKKIVQLGVESSHEKSLSDIDKLIYSFEIDNGGLGHRGCEAFFRYSLRNVQKIERMVAEAEKLRETQFPTLGIGLAHGRITGQRNWLGKLKRYFNPDKETLERALAAVQGPQTYRKTLKELYDDAA